MRRFFINDSCDINEEIGFITLRGGDVNHILHVLRYKKGDSLLICRDQGIEYSCLISDFGANSIICSISDKHINSTEPFAEVILIQGIAKGEKNDLIIQKAVELGVSEIRMCKTERTVVRFSDKKDEQKKSDRWNKISEEAAKQCGRGTVPKVIGPVSFKEAINIPEDYIGIIAYENENETSLKTILTAAQSDGLHKFAFIVGPEGGISPEEFENAVSAGYKSVSLGKRILRTETAGICLLSSVRFLYED